MLEPWLIVEELTFIIIGIHDDASLILLSSEVYVGAMVN
jgi:hypothetical protein